VTADDAARAVGTSAAGRRRAFAANGHLAFTPEAYLARVSAAHADLVASDPTRSFVAAYRAAYRTDPHVTLER
jgi:hypothetical protein